MGRITIKKILITNDDGYIITDMWLEEVLEEIMNTEHGTDAVINVNFPTCRPDELRGILKNRFVSKSCIYKDRYKCTVMPDGTVIVNGEETDEIPQSMMGHGGGMGGGKPGFRSDREMLEGGFPEGGFPEGGFGDRIPPEDGRGNHRPQNGELPPDDIT